MVDVALSTLQFRSCQLSMKLENGSPGEVVRARENLRLSLVQLYRLGYWQNEPQEFRRVMQLYRSCRCLDFSESPSKSGFGRRAQHSP